MGRFVTADEEAELVRAFFRKPTGFFVEVGANDPQIISQTWHLERLGWTGVLIEPLPDFAAALRDQRKARVFAVACTAPELAGQSLPLHVAGPLSAIDRTQMASGARPQGIIVVPARTLDDILVEAGAPQPIDFVSIDTEGHELEVLRGFDLARWQPRLVLLEDHVGDLRRHAHMRGAGYRLIRHTGSNGWYVPEHAAVAASWSERWHILRKYYLGLPFRMLRNRIRRFRQRFE